MSGIKRVVCGISGGVDSAVTAALLKQKGYHVLGAFMKNWDDQDEGGTCEIIQKNDYEDAKSICDFLRIPFVEVSFVKDYWNEVFTRLVEDYERGYTPNPDVMCNKFIKFGSFYKYARTNLGADAIATGHYAQNSLGNFLENFKHFEKDQKAHLLRAVDLTKDQTLFLSDISQNALRRTMFPLGSMYKYHVRLLAKEMGMDKVSKKRDSVGICFIGNRRFTDFISKYIDDKPGVFIDVDSGKVVGEHQGVHHFTLGQRCRIGGSPQAYYVCRRDANTQVIYAASGRDHPSLYSRKIFISTPNWISYQPELQPDKPFNCMFKFQHTEWTIPCSISMQNERQNLTVFLSIPTRAITPGQQAVFYKGNVCLGSAKILGSDSLVNIISDLGKTNSDSINQNNLLHCASS